MHMQIALHCVEQIRKIEQYTKRTKVVSHPVRARGTIARTEVMSRVPAQT